MPFLQYCLDLFLHLDTHLNDFAVTLGPWLYLVLFLIIFCETGLVVTPFLPGDSLLFAVGALAAVPGSSLSVPLLAVLLVVAAVAGNAANYAWGYHVGPRVFCSERSWLFNRKHLLRTQAFYEKYGAKTIVLTRFMPILRTFAPFVAGIGKMEYRRFCLYNVAGGTAWVLLFLLGGYWFGGLEVVKRYFHLVIVAIIVISLLPPVVEFLLARRKRAPAEEPVTADAR
jgi:membrane-associated protein